MNIEIVDKHYQAFFKKLSSSIFHEICFLLLNKFSEQTIINNVRQDFINGQKCIIISNSDMVNFLSKMSIYPILIESKHGSLYEHQIKTDALSINKRLDNIKALLISDINSNGSLKLKKLDHKNMSDNEVSLIKKDNKSKSDIHNKLLILVKSLKLSNTI